MERNVVTAPFELKALTVLYFSAVVLCTKDRACNCPDRHWNRKEEASHQFIGLFASGMSEVQCEAVLSLHAFTGSDLTNCFKSISKLKPLKETAVV